LSRRVHFTITDRQYDELLEEAVRTGRSQAQIARCALDEWLKQGHPRTVRGVEVALFVRRLPRVLRRIHPRLGD
jgi:hypothetical protein